MKVFGLLIVLVALVLSFGLCRAADFLIWDVDGNHNSGPAIRGALLGAGYSGDYTTSITPYLGSLPNYRAIFICTGVFPDYYDLSGEAVAVDSLVSYLTNYDSTNIYLEGGNAWLVCRHHDLNPYFNIQGLANGFGDTDIVLGQAGTFTQGMSLSYSGDNAFMDRIAPLSTAFVIFSNSNPVYNNGIAYDDGDPSYRTIGTSFEFGGLVDGAPPSTKMILADTIMHFFRVWRTTYDWDVAVACVDVPDLVVPNQPLAPRATVRNLGRNTVTFAVTCDITGPYISTDTVYNLAPDSVRQIAFTPDWVPGGAGNSYWVTVYATLAGDQRQTNDTLSKQVTSWDNRWYIMSPYYGSTPPAMDGLMSPGEWDSAEVRDVSDFLGRGGNPRPPGAAYLYVMNDTENVYIALDARADASGTDGDAFYLWFEDNHDASWPPYPDSTEGQLAMIHHPEPAGTWFEFWPMMSSGPPHVPYPVGMPGWSGANSGHMQYELTLPFGSLNQYLTAGAGDTVGLWVGASNEAPQEGYAWWPTSSQMGGFSTADHGDLIFSAGPGIVHDGGVESITSPPDTVWPNSTETPAAIVRNFGNTAEICTVRCTIDPGAYLNEVTIPLNPNTSDTVNFLPWDVPPSGTSYLMTVRIVVPEDNNPGNDVLSKTIVAYHHNGGVASILSPPDTVVLGDTVSVQAVIGNYGTFLEDSIKVRCTIDGWGDSTFVLGLAPGGFATATFADWIPPGLGLWTMTAYTLVADDANPGDDTLSKDIHVIPVGVEEVVNYQLAIGNYHLSQCYPNPLCRTTTIRYAIPSAVGRPRTAVSLSVYDVGGRLVRTLVDEPQGPGYYSVVWDGRDESGRTVPPGVYFYRLAATKPVRPSAGGQSDRSVQQQGSQATDFVQTRKLLVLR